MADGSPSGTGRQEIRCSECSARVWCGRLRTRSQPEIKMDHTRTAIPEQAPATGPLSPVGKYRWRICALLFFATTINYMDRQVLGVLAPYLQNVIGWNELQYGYIVTAFQAAYALG